MTEYNKKPTTGHGVYGNSTETIFVNQHGKAFIVQSPDMPTGTDAIPTDNYLPADMVALGDRDVEDLNIPDWVVDAK